MHLAERLKVIHPATIRPNDWLRFVQIEPFPARWAALTMCDDDLRALELLIICDADRSPVIRGSNGLRKLRFVKRGASQGKSGACRIFYASFPDYGLVLLMNAIAKNQQDDLTEADVKAIGHYLTLVKSKLDQGAIR
jgi:hypothetical protein